MGQGRDKLLETVLGVPLLTLLAGRVAGMGWPCVVTLPPDRPLRIAALAGLPLRQIIVSDAAEGMAASLRAAVRAAGDAPALMTVLGDMPGIDAADLAAMRAAWQASDGDTILRGTSKDRLGQPVILPRRLFAAMAVLTGDTGGRAVLIGERIVAVPLPGDHAILDLDTAQDWAAWRARTGISR